MASGAEFPKLLVRLCWLGGVSPLIVCALLFVPGTPCTLTAKDEVMLQYMLDAVRSSGPFQQESSLDPVLVEALEWQAERSWQDIVAQREAFISALEEADRKMRASGALERWQAGCDEGIKEVRSCFCLVLAGLVVATWQASSGVNGLLLEFLAKITDHVDLDCVNFFRSGSHALGMMLGLARFS